MPIFFLIYGTEIKISNDVKLPLEPPYSEPFILSPGYFLQQTSKRDPVIVPISQMRK